MTAIDKVQYLQIGVQGENVAMNIPFDMTAWAEQYPNATFSILFKPYNETEISPQTSTYDSETKVLNWTVGAGATAVVGVGYTEVRAQDGEGLIKKTRVIPTAVENSVSGVEVNPPAAYADWVTQVLNAGTACVALAHGETVVFSIDDDGHLIYTYTNGDDEPVIVDVGPIDAYAMAVAGGYEGTKAEFEQYVADVLSAVDDAAASAAEAAQYTSDAVHTWLDENIDPDSGYALDRTLTEPLEAAPADMVGDLKSALSAESIGQGYNLPIAFDTVDFDDLNPAQGNISSAGEEVPSTVRVRTGYYYYSNSYLVMLEVATGYAVSVTEYTDGGVFQYQSAWGATGSNFQIHNLKSGLIRFIVKKTDETSDISVAEAKAAISSIKIYKDDLSSFESIRQMDGRQDIPVEFAFRRSLTGLQAKRASSGYFPFDKDCFVYTDTTNNLVQVAVAFYDGSLNYISDESATGQTAVRCIKSNWATAKFIRVYLADMSNTNNEITEALLSFTNEHIKISYGYEAFSLDDLKDSDIKYGSFSHKTNNDVYGYNNVRLHSDKIYINDGRLLAIDYLTGRISIRFFDADFHYVSGADVDFSEFIDLSGYNYPYFGISLKERTGQVITDEIRTSIVSNLRKNAKSVYSYTIAGLAAQTPGALVFQGNSIRCASAQYIWVNDAYIKGNSSGYDFGIAAYNAQKTMIADYGWYSYSTDFGTTDRAIRLKNCYVRFYFAKQGARSSGFTVSEYKALDNALANGSFIEIIESIDPNAIGQRIENGYPDYYDSEMETTINSICSKVNKDSVVFAMITDLHDNDHWHYSEHLAYQQNAIKRIKEKTRLDFVLCGGDLTDGGYSSKTELLDKMTDIKSHFAKIGSPVFFMRGNHDDNSYASKVATNCISRDDFFGRLIMTEPKSVFNTGKTYYYCDFDEINVRVIVLDFIDYPWSVDNDGYLENYAVGGYGVWRGYSNEQINWLAGEALNTNKRIIVTGHYSTHANLMSSWEKQTDHNWNEVNKAMIAYQSRGSYTFDGQTYSYSGKTGKILAQVTGHSHSFGAFKDSGIVWSTTGSPSAEVTNRTHDETQYETMGSRTYGNITEAHFNVFVCDSDNVHIVSFGQMGDLDFEI